MKKILFALTAVAALGATQTTFAEPVGASEVARTQELISALQNGKRQVMLDTLALNPEQLSKFTPVYDEYQAEMTVLMTAASKLNNRLLCPTTAASRTRRSRQSGRKLSAPNDRLALLEKYADKLDKKLPSTKVLQFVQVENKMQVLLDLAVAASIPIVTKTPNTIN